MGHYDVHKCLERTESKGDSRLSLSPVHTLNRRAEDFADIGSKVQCKSDDSYIYAVDIDISKEHIEHKHQKDEHRCTTHYRNVDICNTGQPFPSVHLHPAYERTKKSSQKDAEDGNYDSGLQAFESEHVAVLMDDVADEKDDVADGYDSETGSGEDLTDETTQETDQEDPQENAQEDSQDNNQENDHEDPVEPATADETSSGENETLDAETTPGFSGVLTYEGPDYTVTASFDETAGIPSGASLSVEEITQNQDIYQKYSEQAEKAVGEETDGKVAWVRLFDISIVKDGKTIEPTGPVSVQINYHEAMERPKNAEVKAVHFEGEEEIPVVLDTRAKGEETSVEQVSFDTESFSVFAIVGTTIEKTVLASDGKNYKITVTYGPETKIPEGAELAVEEILPDEKNSSEDDAATTSVYEKYVSKTENALGLEEGTAG